MQNGIDNSIFSSSLAFSLNQATLQRMAEKPDLRVLNLEDVTIETLKEYLRGRGSQEWLRHSITGEDELESVAKLIQGEFNRIHAHVSRSKDQ